MKKSLMILLASAVLSLAGCGSEKGSSAQQSDSSTGTMQTSSVGMVPATAKKTTTTKDLKADKEQASVKDETTTATGVTLGNDGLE